MMAIKTITRTKNRSNNDDDIDEKNNQIQE